jgi:hypothetical protein
MPLEGVLSLLRAGRATAETLVWRLGMAEWTPLGQVAELSAHLPRPAAGRTATPAQPEPADDDILDALEAGAVPIEGFDDEDDEPTSMFQTGPRMPPRRPAPARRALDSLHEDSITRTQTDLTQAVGPVDVAAAGEALATIEALKDLAAARQPKAALVPPPFPPAAAPAALGAAPVASVATPAPRAPAPFTEARLAAAAPTLGDEPSFRPARGKVLVMLGAALAAVALVVVFLARSGGEADVTVPAPGPTAASVVPAPAQEAAATQGAQAPQEPARAEDPEVTEAASPPPTASPAAALRDQESPAPKGDGFLGLFEQAARGSGAVSAPFDPKAALAALKARTPFARRCAEARGLSGTALVAVTFAPSGEVEALEVSGEELGPAQRCISDAMRKATVPRFSGESATASLSLRF